MTHQSCWLILLLSVLCMFLSVSGYELVPAMESSPVKLDGPNPLTGRTRFAYVAMHYEGTPRDDEYLLGLRVTIHSLQKSGTKQDIVILLSNNVRQSTRDTLLSDGVKLAEIQNLQNPFKNTSANDQHRRRTYKARFEFTFNKLYLWNLTDYERVVYLDSDNIIVNNPDELFMCGHFCVVFMNPLLFHTGLMVVKPDTAKFEDLRHTLFSDSSYSHDGADQGFLCAYFDMEDTPLFVLDDMKDANGKYVPSNEPRQRLAIGYNLNHFFYYVHFSWAFIQRLPYHFAKHAIPGLTLAYPSNWWLKPWYWYPPIYFYHTWTWQSLRLQLEGQDFVVSTLTFLLTLGACAVGAGFLINAFGNTKRNKLLLRIRSAYSWMHSFSPVYLGYINGIIAFFTVFIACIKIIPMTTPSTIAFPLYIMLFCTLYSLLYYAYVQLLRPLNQGSRVDRFEAAALIGYEQSVSWNVFAVFALTLLMTSCLMLPIFTHFIIKIGTLVWVLMLWIGINAHQFRRAAERMLQPSNEWNNPAIMQAISKANSLP